MPKEKGRLSIVFSLISRKQNSSIKKIWYFISTKQKLLKFILLAFLLQQIN